MNTLIPVGQEWDAIKTIAHVSLKSQLIPKTIDSVEKAGVIILAGRELGIGPIEALNKINVIQGKTALSPELMKARVHARYPGAIFDLIKSTKDISTFLVGRPGSKPIEMSYTIEEAAAMGLTTRDNWKKQAAVMLTWRNVARICRTVFPECLSGASYTPEELGAEVDEDGEVIRIEPTIKPELELFSQTPEQMIELTKLCKALGIESPKRIKELAGALGGTLMLDIASVLEREVLKNER